MNREEITYRMAHTKLSISILRSLIAVLGIRIRDARVAMDEFVAVMRKGSGT